MNKSEHSRNDCKNSAPVFAGPRHRANSGHPGLAEAQRAIGALFEDGDVFEIRALDVDRTADRPGFIYSGYFEFKNSVAISQALSRLKAFDPTHSRASGIYVVLNQINPALLARANNRLQGRPENTTKDADIVRRRWLYIDADSKRPAAISATDAEHDAALGRAKQIREFLTARGWPEPIYADSGNGAHLFYRLPELELPRAGELVKACLKALAPRFSDAVVTVDEGVFNAARLVKLPGTVAGKGDSTADRPHRFSHIIDYPEQQTVSLGCLETLAAEAFPADDPKPSEPRPSERKTSPSSSSGWLDTWIAKHPELNVVKGPESYKGGRKWTLGACPFNSEHLEAAIFDSVDGKSGYGFKCFHESCKGNHWAELRKLLTPAGPRDHAAGHPLPPRKAKTGDDWEENLIYGKDGLKANLANAAMFLRNHQDWAGVLAFNEFSLRVVTSRPAPWQSAGGAPWTDFDSSKATIWLQQHFVNVGSNIAREAVVTVASEKPFHPVRDYFNSLQWDGAKRLDHWLTSYLKVKESPYSQAVGAKWMLSAVARIFEPGCQADYTLLLEGEQGLRKSSAMRALAGNDWFTDHISNLDNKDARVELCGLMILELAELAAFKGTAVSEKIKAFLSTRVDHFRKPYGHFPEDVPRQLVFCGSVNTSEPFTDETGNRRFWPVKCEGAIDIDGITQARDQLWAEAVHRYRAGEQCWLDNQELEAAAKEEQDNRFAPGVWDDVILKWLDNPTARIVLDPRKPADPPCESSREQVTVSDILLHCIGIEMEKWDQKARNQVARCLVHNKWRRRQIGPRDSRKWVYQRAPVCVVN